MKEINIASNGQLMIVIKHYKDNKIDIEFEDGTIVKNKSYGNFIRGHIANKNCVWSPNKAPKRIGETRVMNCGMKATIIRYASNTDIDVKFEDGTIVKNRAYYEFKNGIIRCPIFRVGEAKITYCGLKATILRYYNRRVDIEFEDGTIVRNRWYRSFLKGYGLGHPTLRLHVRDVARGSYLGTFDVLKLAYRLKDPRDVYYICQCKKCGYKDILTPTEMLAHKCEVQ